MCLLFSEQNRVSLLYSNGSARECSGEVTACKTVAEMLSHGLEQ